MFKPILSFVLPLALMGGSLTACKSQKTPEETMAWAYDAVQSEDQEEFNNLLCPAASSYSTRSLRANNFSSLKAYLAPFEDLRISNTKMIQSDKGLLAPGVCGDAQQVYEVAVIGNEYQIHRTEAQKGQKSGTEERVYVKDLPVLTATVVCHRYIEDESYSYAYIPCTKYVEQSQRKKETPADTQSGSQAGSQSGSQTRVWVERDATADDDIDQRCDIVSWTY